MYDICSIIKWLPDAHQNSGNKISQNNNFKVCMSNCADWYEFASRAGWFQFCDSSLLREIARVVALKRRPRFYEYSYHLCV